MNADRKREFNIRYINPDANEGLPTQKLTNCEIRYDMFSCQDCNKYVCLFIQNKINVIEKLNLLVIKLNMNDDLTIRKKYVSFLPIPSEN